MPRLYAPVTPADLTSLTGRGFCRPAPVFAVTEQVRTELPSVDEEEREHFVTQLAAAASSSDPVVVAVFQVADRVAKLPAQGTAVLGLLELADDLTRLDLVCLLVGDEGERVSEDADLELSWYDASELDVVCRLLES